MKRRATITEAQLRKIILDELVQQSINEGLWDDAQSGAKKISAFVTKQFKGVAASWAKAIAQSIHSFDEIPENAKKIMQVLKASMKETGESFKMDKGLLAAKQLGELGSSGALAAVQSDLEGPVHDKAKQASTTAEGKYVSSLYEVLVENAPVAKKKRLNEDFGVTSAVGISLAVMGGLPLLFKGLHKLALKLGAPKSAELFEKAEHVTHHFEQKVVDFAMPFKLAYSVYLGLWKLGIKLTSGDEPLNELEIKAEDEGKKAIAQCKGLVYKTLLIYFAFQGLAGALKAGASMLGFVEGTATTIKGIELARGAEEIIKLVRAGAGGMAV